MLKTNFSKLPGLVYGKPVYASDTIGRVYRKNLNESTVHAKVNTNDVSDCFYAGEPVILTLNNTTNNITLSTFDTSNPDASIQDVTFNAMISPVVMSFTNYCDKSNSMIEYKVFERKDNEDWLLCFTPNGHIISVKALENLKYGDKVTFAVDANKVLGVKKAISGNKVYGIVRSKYTTENNVVLVKFDFENVTVLS